MNHPVRGVFIFEDANAGKQSASDFTHGTSEDVAVRQLYFRRAKLDNYWASQSRIFLASPPV